MMPTTRKKKDCILGAAAAVSVCDEQTCICFELNKGPEVMKVRGAYKHGRMFERRKE